MKSSKIIHHRGNDGNVFYTVEEELERKPAGPSPASSTDNAAARFDGTTGRTLQNSALIIADTTGALSRSGSGGIPIEGTNTNDSAASGVVGEVIVNTGSGISLTTNTPVNVTSIALTTGDWDVSALAAFGGAGATVTSNILLSISSTSATQDSTIGRQVAFRFNGGSGHADLTWAASITPYRFSLSSPEFVYLVATAVFTTSTYAVSGRLYARRMR